MIPLIVDLETEWRGGQSQALLLLRGLYERGHAAELVTSKGSVLGHRAKKNGIYVHGVPSEMRRLRAANIIRGILAEGRVDVVHVNEPHALTSAWLAGAHRRTPLLISRRVAYPLQQGWIARKRYQAAHRILAISRFVKQSVVDSGIPAEKIDLVYEGVAVPAPATPEKSSKARQRWGISETDVVFGCVGYLLPEKGQEHIVRAFPAVRAKFPAARLLLAGDGPCRAQLTSLAKELGVENAVIFAGFVEDVPQVYAALNAFLFPSLAEPLGTSLLAAMAWGLPVIAVASGGVPEYVESGRTGLLVARPAADLFAGEMLRLLNEPGLATQLGGSARESIQKNLSADQMVENTIRVYANVAG